jgi:hypothetical protein
MLQSSASSSTSALLHVSRTHSRIMHPRTSPTLTVTRIYDVIHDGYPRARDLLNIDARCFPLTNTNTPTMSSGKALDLQPPTVWPWTFATIHKSDGHKSNGFFYTNDFQVLREFCAAMQPLIVTCSFYPSIEEVQKFASDINPCFVPIDPKTYNKHEM